MIKAIVFDWHGVLDKTTYRDFSGFLSRVTGKNADWIRGKISRLEQEYVRGDVEPNTFWTELKEKLNLSQRQYTQARNRLLKIRLSRKLWARLPALRQRYQLAVLSDCPSDKVITIHKTVDLTLFTVTQFSCENGMSKEDPAFFLLICESLGMQPKQCLYVDDTSKHITKAAQLGFLTHPFTRTEDFARYLRSLVALK